MLDIIHLYMYIKVMKRTADEAAITRQRLLDSALRVFLKKGYADTRVEDISEEAAVTRGAFYHYFASKKAVYYALLDERLAPVQGLFAELLTAGKSPFEKLRAMLVQMLILMKEDRGFRDANELTLFKTGYVEELQEGMVKKLESMKRAVGLMENLLKEAVLSGEVALRVDARSAALHLYAALSGSMTLWLFDDRFFSYCDAAERFADMWLAGIM